MRLMVLSWWQFTKQPDLSLMKNPAESLKTKQDSSKLSPLRIAVLHKPGKLDPSLGGQVRLL